MIDQVHNNAQSIKFCEVFGFDNIVISFQVEYFFRLPILSCDYLFMLSWEKAWRFFHLSDEFFSLGWQLCEFEILWASSKDSYLQKYFLAGKLEVPL